MTSNPLTGVISSARDALEMLWWCAEVFEYELSTTDSDGSRQGFAFLVFAQASASLHHWVCNERFGNGGGQFSQDDRSEFFRSLMTEIPWSHELRAISEAARHAKVTSRYWTGVNLPVLRGDTGRIEELDASQGEDHAWFQNLMRGLTDGSLWFESSLANNGVHTDARKVIVEHCAAWDRKLGALRDWDGHDTQISEIDGPQD